MGLLATLITGAGVNTPSGNQAQMESNIVIGDVDTPCPLRGLNVVIDNKTTIDIKLAVFCDVFAKFMGRAVAGGVGLVIRIATGRIMKSGSITFQNDGVTTPQIFWNSERGNGAPIEAFTDSINANSNKTFTNFGALFCNPIANIGSFDVVWADGTQQTLGVLEADAIFSSKNDTIADGRLNAAATGFDNRDLSIQSVKVNANGTGAVNFMIVK